MSVKEKVKKQIGLIIAEGIQKDVEIINFVREFYRKALEDSIKSEASVKDTAYDLLSGVEDGLRDGGYDIGVIIQKSADTIIEVTYNRSKEEIGRIGESIESAVDKSAEYTEMNLHRIYTSIDNRIWGEKILFYNICEAIEDYADKKTSRLNESTKFSLYEIVGRGRKYVQSIDGLANALKRKLLQSIDAIKERAKSVVEESASKISIEKQLLSKLTDYDRSLVDAHTKRDYKRIKRELKHLEDLREKEKTYLQRLHTLIEKLEEFNTNQKMEN